MALQFQPPPDWLVNDYVNRKNPALETLDSANQLLRTYVENKALQQDQALKQQQQKMLMDESARKGREEFYKRGDVASLPAIEQQQLLNPAQGPANSLPTNRDVTSTPFGPVQMQGTANAESGIPVQNQQEMQFVEPQKSPLIQKYAEFLKVYPQGTEGMTTDTVMKPLPGGGYIQEQVQRPKSGRTIIDKGTKLQGEMDQKKTFQKRQTVYDASGKAIGYQVFDTRSGDESTKFYRQDQMPEGAAFGPNVPPQVPSAAVEKSAGQTGFLQLIDNIEKSYDPKFVGAIDSPIRKASQKYDVPTLGLGASEKGANFERSIADLRSAVINERTGAAVGEKQEWDRLLELIPDDSKSDIDFKTKLQSFKTRYAQIIANREAGYKSAGYRNPASGGGAASDPLGIR